MQLPYRIEGSCYCHRRQRRDPAVKACVAVGALAAVQFGISHSGFWVNSTPWSWAALLPATVPPETPPIRPGGILCVDGVRYVAPYEYHVRARFGEAGQRLGDIIASGEEVALRRGSPDWWAAELAAGRISVERCGWGKLDIVPVDADYILRAGDRFHFRLHLHERAIPDEMPEVLYEDRNMVVVAKPPGIEVCANPQGGALKSSLVGLMEDMGYHGLQPAHRIDKPVSGVVCMARHKKAMRMLSESMKARRVRKRYLARVCSTRGAPPQKLLIDAPLNFSLVEALGKGKAYVNYENGKTASTEILKVLQTDGAGDTALLVIGIGTGRTHQIRCHLEHAGYPIANDPLYGGRAETGRELYRDTPSGDLSEMLRAHRRHGCQTCDYFMEVLSGREPPPTLEPSIWLHSWRYEFPSLGLAFEAPLPAWAQDASSLGPLEGANTMQAGMRGSAGAQVSSSRHFRAKYL